MFLTDYRIVPNFRYFYIYRFEFAEYLRKEKIPFLTNQQLLKSFENALKNSIVNFMKSP